MNQATALVGDAAVQWSLAPRPAHDESLSSWIERVGLFYGTEYEIWLSGLLGKAGEVPRPTKHDVDADESLQIMISGLSRVSLHQVPSTLPRNSPNVLPLHERGTFCALCWNEDVAHGGQPYVRRSWSFWNRVTCPRHGVFLTARRRIGLRASQRTLDWMPLWRSRRHWARAFDCQHDRSLRDSALWYSADRSNTLTPADIGRLTEEAERFGAGETSREEDRPQAANRRAQRALALTMTTEFRAVSDDIRHDLFGFPADSPTMKGNFDSANYSGVSARPYLLENRMALLVTAMEVLRRIEARPSVCPAVERVIERSCYVRRTLDKPAMANYLLAWPAAERQAFLASWWDRRRVRLKDRETLVRNPRRGGTRNVSSHGSVSRIMRVNHATH